MMLNEKDISEFKRLYEEAFGDELDWAEAEQMASELIGLYEVIWLEQIKKVNIDDEV